MAPGVDGVKPPSIGDAIRWTLELARELAARFKKGEEGQGKKVLVIEKKYTVQGAVETIKGEEFAQYQKWIQDPALLRWIEAGLDLRRLESDPAFMLDLKRLRDNLVAGSGVSALHVAQVAQSGALGILLGLNIQRGAQHARFKHDVEKALHDVEFHTQFVQAEDSLEMTIRQAEAKVLANAPTVFIILGQGDAISKALEAGRVLAVSMREQGYTYALAEDRRRVLIIFEKAAK